MHVVTVNDYLARRDAEWMGPIYEFLGLSVGIIQESLGFEERKAAYDADITYGTNAQFGFDYLRDNLATRRDQLVQRDLKYAIVDEVDSILIDEARTPLIISGIPESAADTYYKFARVIPTLKEGEDYEVDEKKKQVAPTESGVEKVEKALGVENLYDDVNTNLVNHLNQALRAHTLFHKDVEYIVRDGALLAAVLLFGEAVRSHRARMAQAADKLRRAEEDRKREAQKLWAARVIQEQLLSRELPPPRMAPRRLLQTRPRGGRDFYDFLKLSDGQLVLVAGDVTDKGIPAALVMATAHSILRDETPGLASPGAALERANERLYPQIPPHMFVTCLYAVLDPAIGLLRCANAGHNLPYVATADGVTELRTGRDVLDAIALNLDPAVVRGATAIRRFIAAGDSEHLLPSGTTSRSRSPTLRDGQCASQFLDGNSTNHRDRKRLPRPS